MRVPVWVCMTACVFGLGACATKRSVPREALVAPATACHAQRFDIYFEEGQARLTPAAREAVGLTSTLLQGCAIEHVQVIGLADASGSAGANQDLSQARAQAVVEALAATGWPTPTFEVEAMGDQGATTASGVSEPLRRRTEVIVTAAPR